MHAALTEEEMHGNGNWWKISASTFPRRISFGVRRALRGVIVFVHECLPIVISLGILARFVLIVRVISTG